MKSLIAFSHTVLQDLGDRCSISTGRDCKTVTARGEHEGESFFTITLPKFGKDFQKSLAQGFIDRSMFLGFKKHGELPRFLGGFLDLVFCRKTGRLLDDPSVDAIFSIHQFCSMFGKFFDKCSQERESKAIDDFIKCEQDLRRSDAELSSDDLGDFVRIASMLYSELFTEVDRMVYYGELLPKHGPGKTAEKLTSNAKYSQKEWTARLERVFPLGEFLFPNWGWYQTFPDVEILEPGDERPVRIVTVPKTQSKPRIIAVEPACMQYTQQALHIAIAEFILRDGFLNSILGNESQEPNRLLARKGSLDGSLATLDLSEASDRVSNQLVRAMLDRWPNLHEAVDASRSRKADVPGYGVQRLTKFASMGSALTFEMEGLVFTSLVFLGLERALKRRLTKRSVRSFVGRVRVYGDDIIVPVEAASSVIAVLETFGLKVNADKSFWSGRFRESCGGDYYAGRPITPVRMRKRFPSSREHVDEVVSTVSFRNRLYEAGFERSVEYLDSMLAKLLPVYPEVPVGNPALGRWTWSPVMGDRIHPRLHKPEIRAYVKEDVIPKDPLGDHGALMKYFLKRGDLPIADRKHLQRAGRPTTSALRLAWVSLDMRETSV